jgi:hypothetical protein
MKWWQRLAGSAMDIAKNLLDDSQPVERLHGFLQASLEQVDLSNTAKVEAAYACHLASERGIIRKSVEVPASHPDLPSRTEFEHWHQSLNDGRVIDRSGMAPGTGRMLLSILDDPGQHMAFLHTELERLLRHVEIKRQAALELAGEYDTETQWLERHAVAILFSRTARHQDDLRYLNTALKLNDWAFPSHRRLRSGAQLERYLWSLVEQELSWKALLG